MGRAAAPGLAALPVVGLTRAAVRPLMNAIFEEYKPGWAEQQGVRGTSRRVFVFFAPTESRHTLTRHSFTPRVTQQAELP